MGKRKGDNKDKPRSKKFKNSGFIDVNTSGIYATCNRGKEKGCTKELMSVLQEKIQHYYDNENENENEEPQDTKELSIEEQILKEVSDLNQTATLKTSLLSVVDINCECLVFIKTRKPIDPEILVREFCQEALDSKQKTTRFTQKLTPIKLSTSASIEELKKLAREVLAPHFHNDVKQQPLKFAIQVSRRHFNAIDRDEIIRTVAESVGKDHGHSVDLKTPDVLIIVECFKTNIGMSVVRDYEKLYKYNLQTIYDKSLEINDTDI